MNPGHPLAVVLQPLAQRLQGLTFEFHAYGLKDAGPENEDSRPYGPTVDLPALPGFKVVSTPCLADLLVRLGAPAGHEVVVRSRVGYDPLSPAGSQSLHLPLLDFTGTPRPRPETMADLCRENIQDQGLAEILAQVYAGLRIFHSGRSYHAYGTDVLGEACWRDFMAAALLMPGIDSRWVAHSLLRGYGALRLTRTNTSRYLALPELVNTAASVSLR